MKLIRRIGIVGALAASWLSASACSDDENVTSSDGGSNESGTSTNSGGAKSSGGGGGRGGAGGSAGKGTGGAATGGRNATGGGTQTGGKGGAGGAATGGAGTGGSSAGSGGGGAGTGGVDASTEGGPIEGGADADAGPRVPKACSYKCDSDADCLLGTDAAPDSTYKCHPTRKRCENPIEMCSVHADCVALASFWFPSCTSDQDCLFPGDVCVDAGGFGLCATPAPADGGSCVFPPQRVTRNRFGGSDGGPVDVCSDTSGRCNDNHCFGGCDSSACTSQAGTGLTCNASSGLCECAASSECALGTCSSQSHHCECVANADCVAPGQDVCVDGACGCSDATACPASVFRNATPVCD